MLRAWAVTHLQEHVAEDGRRSRQNLTEELTRKFATAIEAFNDIGSRRPPPSARTPDLRRAPTGKRYTHGTLTRRYERDAALSWLGEREVTGVDVVVPDDDKAPRVRTFGTAAATPEEVTQRRDARKLGGDRSRIRRRVRVGNRVSERRFFRDWSAIIARRSG